MKFKFPFKEENNRLNLKLETNKNAIFKSKKITRQERSKNLNFGVGQYEDESRKIDKAYLKILRRAFFGSAAGAYLSLST